MEPPTVEANTVSSLDRDAAPAPEGFRVATSFCIAGMHRTGTSMVASLLHACGIFLGPEDELSEPGADNPAGYFEHPDFLKLNEHILAQFGGSWSEPPTLSPGWESSDELSPLVERAEELLSRARRPYWGWKDPRNSLTLPFWKRLIPDLKIIICVRSPVEVMRSLIVRGDSSEFQLWLAYYRQLLSAIRSEDYVVTHYRSYFQNSRAELRRILDWLGAPVSDNAVDNACGHISADLRHHFVTTTELIGAQVPDEVLSVYFNLCAEAGPVYEEARKHEAEAETDLPDARKNEVNSLVNALETLRTEHETLKQTQTEILNSKAFKLASWYWRLRGGK